jgi:octaprenyl-diphosphate synthase
MPPLLETPPDLRPLQEAVTAAMTRVEQRVAAALHSDQPPIAQLCEHLSHYHGKMLRPMLVLLCGMATNPRAADDDRTGPRLITLGAVIEMVHLASLVHDDVLDEADIRRQTQTINRLAGNEAAVMLGDYVFSAAYHLCATLRDPATSQEISRTAMLLCAGELLQLHHRGNLSLDEKIYFELIDGKTASLIATAASLGCVHAGGDAVLAERFHLFGNRMGLAFQIQDDLLDLTGDQRVVGKSLGKDVEKGKLTLPIIHHLNIAPPAVRGHTLQMLENPVATPRQTLTAALESTGSIEHARTVARTLVREGKAALAPVPSTPAKRLLELMADAVVNRTY